MVWLKFCPSTGANGGEKGKVTVTLSELPVGTVAGLKTEVIKQVNSAFNEIQLVHCGKKLLDGDKLADFPTLEQPNATVYVFCKKTTELTQEISPMDVESLLTSMQVGLQDRNARASLFKIAGDVEVLSNLIATVPALKNDIVAQGVVKDPFLLIHWLSPPNIRETLKKHPALFDAAQQLLAIMHTEASKPPPPGHPLLFPALPDEDESDEENGAARNRTANRQNVARPSGLAARPITADQLAIALATAAGRTTPATPPTAVGRGTAGPSTAAGSTSRLSTPARPAINADFLQQAIAAASVRSPQINETQLSQLRDMGFIDDAENRRALVATNGNVEAALEWIINEREQNEMD